ncbi:MAG TPA: flagellar hook-basal body complex protein [Pirellulales bacterium]|nr:flagellar hook-basal body complex protein [Pirellulales bacterium]
MSLSSVFSTAISGLQAAETSIDVTGNNVANANTIGFKQSTAEFATQFLQTMSIGAAPSTDNGGVNPTQVGLGVQVAAITPDFTQGNLEISSSTSDMAIQGNGFFVVQGSGTQQLYTRNGNFTPNSQNELTTSTGQVLMGYGVDSNFNIQTTQLQPLTIPLGSTAVAKATQNVELQGTLPPTGDLATTGAIVQSGDLGDAAMTAPTGATAPVLAPVPDVLSAGTTATGAPGGNMTAGGTYSYKIVFANGPVGSDTDTQSLPSQTIGPITLAAGEQSVTLNNIPTDPTGTYTDRYVYRTAAGGSSYQLVADIPDNTTTTYTDTAADTSLGQSLDTNSLDGDYSYYVTYANAIGGPGHGVESRPTQLLGPINVVNGAVELQNLPVDTSGQWSVRRIYRTSANDPNVATFVAEVPNMNTNVSYTDTTPDSAIVNNAQLNLNGPPITGNTLLTNVLQYSDGSYQNLFQLGTLSFTGTIGGTQQAPQTFSVTAQSTVQDLANFMDQALGIQSPPGPDPNNPIPNDSSGLPPGVSITSQGQLQFVSNAGVDNAVSIGLSALQLTPTNGTAQTVPLTFNQTQAAVGQSVSANFVAYDSLGIPVNVNVTCVLQARTSTQTVYRWYADSPQNDPTTGSAIAVGTGLITFNGEGQFVSATNSTVAVQRAHVPSAKPLEFNLDFSQLSGLAATAPSLSVTSQDGFPPGKLTSYTVGSDGVIKGSFDNGTQRDLGQLVLARFANPAGLLQAGQNLYTPGVNSGLPVTGTPNADGIGSIVSGALEESNTDVSTNLINLITSSTQYRANSEVINTAETLFNSLLQLGQQA